jgi:hypothetical protein
VEGLPQGDDHRPSSSFKPMATTNAFRLATRNMGGKARYRKRTDNIGEKRIERELFNVKSKGFELISTSRVLAGRK